MKRVHYFKGNRTGNLLHIETEGAIVNIRVGLHNPEGQEVTSIQIQPDDTGAGENWTMPDENGEHMKGLNVQVIKKAEVGAGVA